LPAIAGITGANLIRRGTRPAAGPVTSSQARGFRVFGPAASTVASVSPHYTVISSNIGDGYLVIIFP
jgi:hypothetical protein